MNDPKDKIMFPQITDFNDLFDAIATYQNRGSKDGTVTVVAKPTGHFYCGGLPGDCKVVKPGPIWQHTSAKPKQFVYDAVENRSCEGGKPSFKVIKDHWLANEGKVLIWATDRTSIPDLFIALVDPATIPGYEVLG
jgi:hypothetical protein